MRESYQLKYIKDPNIYYHSLSWIQVLYEKQKSEERYIPSLKEYLQNHPGFVYITHQPRPTIDFYTFDFPISIETLIKDEERAFCSFTYIVSEVIDILFSAIEAKEKLHHNFIHIQIDCSFKCTRPLVYCVPRIEIGHETIPLGVIVTPTERKAIFELFFNHLSDVINKYNILNPEKQLNFNLSNVLFLSNEGKSEKSFYQSNNYQHCYCLSKIIGSIDTFSELALIVKEIFNLLSSND